jgi:alpha-ribazole phosphatase
MQKVWIIDVLRHGETTLSHTLRGHLDDALTQTGWQQMQTTIEQMQPSAWQVVLLRPYNVVLHLHKGLQHKRI